MAKSGISGEHGATVVTIVILVLAQLVLSGRFEIFGATPSYMFVLTCCVAFIEGSKRGCVAGFAFGLFQDLVGSGHVGVGALFACILGYVVGSVGHGLLAEGAARPIAIFAACDVVYNLAYMIATSLLGSASVDGANVFLTYLSSVAADTVVACVSLILLARFFVRRRNQITGLGI